MLKDAQACHHLLFLLLCPLVVNRTVRSSSSPGDSFPYSTADKCTDLQWYMMSFPRFQKRGIQEKSL